MDVEKRKRFEDRDGADGKKAKVEVKGADEHTPAALNCGDRRADEDGGDADADGEVEEFYAILRRIHVAVKYFENGKATGKKKTNSPATAAAKPKATATATSWNLNFKREDFEGGCCDNGLKEDERSVSDSASLDLNVEPDPDSE
ncbi:OLC1v1032311C1 [Oldenlandia corymbosa var. corymbosa]|uniref:OLC1v1032311C1 n=1 Tax=Oldenlandia corymbosa var. corymbosa TaxID=529605 RepID=A0AAV1CNM7_OLDCO|nr:OLC1v1032311C1 [Oldenlandia corymbosa var. corymbosa]